MPGLSVPATLLSSLAKLAAKHPEVVGFLDSLLGKLLRSGDPWRTMQRAVLAKAGLEAAKAAADGVLKAKRAMRKTKR